MKYLLHHYLSGLASAHQTFALIASVINDEMIMTGADESVWTELKEVEKFGLKEIKGQVTIKNADGLGTLIEWSAKPITGVTYTPIDYQIYRIAPDFDMPQPISQVNGVLGVAETVGAILSIINSFPEIKLDILTHDPQVLQATMRERTGVTLPLFDDYADTFGKLQEAFNIGNVNWIGVTSQRLAGLGYYGNAQLILVTGVTVMAIGVFTAWNKEGKFAQYAMPFVIEDGVIKETVNSLELMDNELRYVEVVVRYHTSEN